MFRKKFIPLIALLVLAGCNILAPVSPTATVEVLTTEPVISVPTPVPPTNTPSPSATPTEYVPLSGKIASSSYFLRSGPGYMFDSLATLAEGQLVSILGRAPGDLWFYVSTPEKQEGWLNKLGLAFLSGIPLDVPVQTPQGVTILRGHVYTTNGSPADDVTLMINPENATDTVNQDVAITDFLGRWYFYLPIDRTGNWTIVANDAGCQSSAVNAMCSLIGKFSPPQTLSLPQTADSWLDFQLVP